MNELRQKGSCGVQEKLRVLWVTNAFGCGGAERQMLYMYSILQQYCNIDITILYYAKVGDELTFDDVKTVFVDKAKVGKIKTVREIARFIRKNNIQIMHAFGGSSANVYGRWGTVFTKAVPVGAVLGKRHFASIGMKIANSLLNLFGNWWTVNNLELIPTLRRDLKFVSSERIRMLHNGFVPASRINYQTGIQTEYDIDKGEDFVFCAVGRLQPVKNYGLYLRAAQRIIQKYEGVRFWVVGNGEEYQHLMALAGELGIGSKVRFWGFRRDVDVILYRCDAFVQTSFTEGSPNTIAEAMRAGKPIISTKSTDLSEMIEQDQNGYIVPNDDVDQLLMAMENMLQKSQGEREQMGRHSETLFTRNFLDSQVAREFDRFYHEILKEG